MRGPGTANVGVIGNVAVGEEAAFDGLYNIALQPAIGAPPVGQARALGAAAFGSARTLAPAIDFHRALARAARG